MYNETMDYAYCNQQLRACKQAIEELESKISEQGAITNARDEEHLAKLKQQEEYWYSLMRSY